MITKWKYEVVAIGIENGDSIRKQLNSMGDEGWELVGFSSCPSAAFFKRTAEADEDARKNKIERERLTRRLEKAHQRAQS